MRSIRISLVHLEPDSFHKREILRGIFEARQDEPAAEVFHEVDLGLWDGKSPLRNLAEGGADGVLTFSSHSRLEETLVGLDLPVLNLSNNSPLKAFPSITVDDVEVGRTAGRHVLELGVRGAAIFCHGDIYHGHPDMGVLYQERSLGFLEVLRNAGLSCVEPTPNLACTVSPPGKGGLNSPTSAWFSRLEKGIALFAPSEDLPCLQWLQRMGRSVPDDHAVVSAGNDPLYNEWTRPALSSVHLDACALGRLAFRAMVAHLKGEAPLVSQRLKPGDVIVRESSSPRVHHREDMQRALDHIEDHLNTALCIDDILSTQTCSRRTFESRFRKEMGEPVKQYVLKRKIEKAKLLLRQRKGDFAGVAYELGFSSQSHFQTLFKRRVGMTPGAYLESVT